MQSSQDDSEDDSKPEILIRRPSHLLSRDIPRHWYGGDAFATHFLNALSSTFPFGEAFFVRSVLRYREQIADPQLLDNIRGFAGQEGQHSHVHQQHVEMLVAQGYAALETRNRFVDRIARWHNRHTPKLSLTMTAGLEHLTALLARRILSEPELRTGEMHPEMAQLWRWHALEEAEHKAVAFDVLMQVSPSHSRRVVMMALNTFGLSLEILDRMVYMLWKDGLLFKAATWSGGWRFLFAEGGFLRGMGPDYRAWYRKDFHPNEIDDQRLIDSNAPLIEAEIAALPIVHRAGLLRV